MLKQKADEYNILRYIISFVCFVDQWIWQIHFFFNLNFVVACINFVKETCFSQKYQKWI